MISDPDDPEYYYPQPGERLWHRPWQCWIEVTGDGPEWAVIDEVPCVRVSTGQRMTVKLRSLEKHSMSNEPVPFQPYDNRIMAAALQGDLLFAELPGDAPGPAGWTLSHRLDGRAWWWCRVTDPVQQPQPFACWVVKQRDPYAGAEVDR